MAMTSKGVLHHEVLETNCNTSGFVKFIQDLPVQPGTRLVMDNLSFHKSAVTRDAIEAKQCKPLYIPPYSPRFNAIEYAFGSMKRLYRQECSALQASSGCELGRSDYEELLQHTVLFPYDLGPFVKRTLDTVNTVLASNGAVIPTHDG